MAFLWYTWGILCLVRLVLSVAIPLPPPVKNVSLSALPKTLLPIEDPFYAPPKGFESAKLGTILRSRAVSNKITLDNKNPIRLSAAWQLLYRTQNSVKEPTAAVVTVLVPFRGKPNHLLSYAMFSDSAFSGCNPSVTLQIGTRDDNQWNQIQIPILIQALSLGYYVSVADYAGTQAAFSAGPQAGYATLDSLRAVFASGNLTKINPDPITTLHGYSSGAQAVGWATELHPTYAPDLKIAGAAFGGLVPNLTALVELPSYRNGPRSALGPPVILGLSHDYENMSNWLEDNLVPAKTSLFRLTENQCVSANDNFTHMDLGGFLNRGYESLFVAVTKSIFAEAGTMGQHSTPTIPWYLYHAAGDDVSPQILSDRVVEKHCKNGADILYERTPLPLNHRLGCIYGLGGAYRWMMDRHEGKPIVKGCKTVTFSDESKKAVMTIMLVQGVMSSIWAWLGFKVGPGGGVIEGLMEMLSKGLKPA